METHPREGYPEIGATNGKTELAKRAKALNLDAIHDTVHERARRFRLALLK